MYRFLHNPRNALSASADLLGDCLSFDAPWPTPRDRPHASLVIAHQSAAYPHRSVPVTKDWLLIGRGESNDVRLSTPLRLVSQHHAEIRWEDKRFWLVDLGSKNGTWLAGRRLEVGKRYVLRPGAYFMVGDFLVAFAVSEPR